MSVNEPIIHSRKPLSEYLSNLNFVLGMVSIIAFVLSLFLNSTPVQGQTGGFSINYILISTICLVGNIISSVALVAIAFMYQKNFVHYHYRAIFGFFLALLPIVLTAIAGK